MINAYMNWSGGKDSSLCLFKALQSGRYQVRHLLTSFNSVYDRVSMHGVRRGLLEAQAKSIGIPLTTIELPEQPDMQQYEISMTDAVESLKSKGCSQALFGDIFLEDLRRYREEKLKAAGIECIFPLWKLPTRGLVKEFIGLGFQSVIVCVQADCLDKSFCGRRIDESFLSDLPVGVDPCGENGEFHSFVFDGPLFTHPIDFRLGDIVYREYTAPKNAGLQSAASDSTAPYGFYFCDLLPLQ